MTCASKDVVFSGPVSEVYEKYLVPMIFQPYADDMLNRLLQIKPTSVLEIAAGTGAVTRAMAASLPASTAIVASDLNQGMLDQAMAQGTACPVEWRIADAMQLPFEDESFDAIVCQFGAIFFPDKAKAFSEIRRVLKPGGQYIFNVWDTLIDNDFAGVVHATLATLYPENPPAFLARTPYGYNDVNTLRQAVAAGGFEQTADIEVVTARGKVSEARDVAMGYCQGTPLRGEISAFGPTQLAEATNRVEKAIVKQFGVGALDSKIQALVVSIRK